MGYDIQYVDSLNDDLASLRLLDEHAYLIWQQVINEIWDNDALRAELTSNRGFRAAQPQFDTVFIQDFLKLGFNIGRVKIYLSPNEQAAYPQRLLYAIDHRISPEADGTVWLLGLMPRKVDYVPSDPFIQRICKDYDARGIPRVGDCR